MPDPSQATEIKDVPAKKVGTNVQQVIQAGAIKIVCTRQENGKWTIRVS